MSLQSHLPLRGFLASADGACIDWFRVALAEVKVSIIYFLLVQFWGFMVPVLALGFRVQVSRALTVGI